MNSNSSQQEQKQRADQATTETQNLQSCIYKITNCKLQIKTKTTIACHALLNFIDTSPAETFKLLFGSFLRERQYCVHVEVRYGQNNHAALRIHKSV